MSIVNKTRLSGVGTTPVAISASPGTLHELDLHNPNSSEPMHVHLYDAATGDVTVGTTTPRYTFILESQTARRVRVRGSFATAITIACTQDDGSTAPTAGANGMALRD